MRTSAPRGRTGQPREGAARAAGVFLVATRGVQSGSATFDTCMEPADATGRTDAARWLAM